MPKQPNVEPHEFFPNRQGKCKQILGKAGICGLTDGALPHVQWASKHHQEEQEELSVMPKQEPSGLVEIARSYSFKLNMERVGGPRYETRDFYCSCKEECLKADATATSARLHVFCQAEVARAVNEYMKTRKKPALAPAPKQTSFTESPLPDDDDVPF
jgi:hypothetical protein